MSGKTDVIVIGAGVVGLAVARKMALNGLETIILEKEERIGEGVSSRSSEVIHAGLYYPTDSLKARLCVAGRKALYEYCESHGVGFKKTGKLVVAFGDEEVGALEALKLQAQINGVEDVSLLDRLAARRLEPDLECGAALLSPSTGIVDSHGLMLALLGDCESAGAALALGTPLERARIDPDGRIVLETGGIEPMTITAQRVVNCAALGAWDVAKSISGLPEGSIPPRYLAKGSYFSYARKAPFSHLVYPLPAAAGLGIHMTLDMGGQARFGPDVEWVGSEDYGVDKDKAGDFAKAIGRYFPGIEKEALQPAYAGVRPKLAGRGEPPQDFMICGPGDHGVDGLVNLFGIESPGLTSCLAIADEVARVLDH